MARQEINVVGGFYKDPNLHWSAQDVLNWIPVPAEKQGVRTRFQLRDAPGFKPFVRITKKIPDGEGFVTVDQGPIRGMRNVEGKLFVVAGTTLYQINNAGVAIPFGTIPGVGRVSMAHNERGSGNQLLIVNGSAGYVLDTVSLVFQKITDAGYPGAFIADFADGYLAQVEPQGRYWLHSDLSQALDYNTFDQYEAEADPDRIVTLHVSFREVLVFGADTIEPFVNTGATQGTFQRASNTVIQCGCSAKFSPKTMDNSVIFLDDKRIVRRLDGYTPVRISTIGIEAALAECTREEIAAAYAVTYEDRGHKIYYLTVPGRFTFGWDVLSGEWHRRSSPGRKSWRLSDLVFWSGEWIGGDAQSGRLYKLDWGYSLDSDEELERERVTGVTSAEQNPITVNEIELLFNVGGSISIAPAFPAQPELPTITGDAPNGTIGIAYAGYAYAVTGASPLTVTLRSGTLPPGVTLNATGVLSTTVPTAVGAYPFTLRVTDGNGLYAELADMVLISNVIALLGGSSSTLRPFLLFGSGGTDWENAYQYNGNTPPLGSTGLLGGGGHWLSYDGSSTLNPVYSTDASATSWVVSSAAFGAATKTQFGCYSQGVFLIPANDGVYHTNDYGQTLTKPTTIPAYAVDASEALAMSASLYNTDVATAPKGLAPYFSTWTGKGVAHGIDFSGGGIVRHGGTRFFIGGSDGANPKAVFTVDGTSFTSITLPALSAAYFFGAAYDRVAKRWVAGTSVGQLLYMDEADGIWHLSATALGSGMQVKNILHNGIVFVAAANHNVTSGLGKVVYSVDGVLWTTAPTLESINAQTLAVMQ